MTSNEIHVANNPDFIGQIPPQLLRAIKKTIDAWQYVERHYGDDRGVQKFVDLGDVEQLRQALMLYGNGRSLPAGVINDR